MSRRLLFIHQYGGRGGASTTLANILATLDRKRYEARVVTPPGDAAAQFEAAGATVTIAPRPIRQFAHTTGYSTSVFHPLFLKTFIQIQQDRRFWRDYIRQSGADLVHLNAVTLAPMALAIRRTEHKIVCLVQETAVPGLLGLRTRWLRHLLRTHVDAAVFISEYDRAAFGCDCTNAEVIPNWVDFRTFDRTTSKATCRERLGLPPNAKAVLFLGGIAEIKGTLPLLEACEDLADIPDFVLLLAGYTAAPDPGALSLIHRGLHRLRVCAGRDYHQRAMTLLSREPLKSHVRLPGMSADVVPLYAACDVVAFPAVRPHQARPVLEAGAMAKPVVVSDFANLREFVVNGVTGLTVPPGDPCALSQALRRVLLDARLAESLGQENYALAQRAHNGDINAAKFARLYDRLLDARPDART